MSVALSWQPTLPGSAEEAAIDRGFAGLDRIQLDDHCWLDYLPGWVRGEDHLFAELVDASEWAQRTRHLYDKVVAEPRLTSSWHASGGRPLRPPLLEEMRAVLSARVTTQVPPRGRKARRSRGNPPSRIQGLVERACVRS